MVLAVLLFVLSVRPFVPLLYWLNGFCNAELFPMSVLHVLYRDLEE